MIFDETLRFLNGRLNNVKEWVYLKTLIKRPVKQQERADAIVKRLYELKDGKYSYTLTEIMKYLDIYESDEDMHRMATRLKEKRLAKLEEVREGVYVEIDDPGKEYYEEFLSSAMSEAGKLRAILKWLYPRRHQEGMLIPLESIMEELGIYESRPESERLVKEMVRGELVDLTPIEDGSALIHGIMNKGIKRLRGEATGGSERASAQINIHGDFHAVNAAIGHNYNVQQTATISNQSLDLIHKIREGIEASPEIEQDHKNDLLDSINDIEKNLKSGEKVPRYQWKNFLGNAANATQVIGFIKELAEQNGFQFPSL